MLDYDRKLLGDFLKECREKAELTQWDVSKKLGYTSPQFISNIERGQAVVPLKTLSRMVQMYKVDADQVVRLILESQRKVLKAQLAKKR